MCEQGETLIRFLGMEKQDGQVIYRCGEVLKNN